MSKRANKPKDDRNAQGPAVTLRDTLSQPKWYLGLLILTASETAFLTETFWSSTTIPFMLIGSVYALASAAALTLAAFAFRKGFAASRPKRLYAIAAMLYALSLVMLAVLGAFPTSTLSQGLAVGATILVASAYAPLVLLWIGLYGQQPISRTFALLAFAYAGGCIASFVVVALSPQRIVELIVAATVLYTTVLYGECQPAQAPNSLESETSPKEAPFPAKPVIICGVVAFVTTFLQNLSPASHVPTAIFFGALLTVAVLILFLSKPVTDLLGLQQVTLVMAVAASLSIPFAGTEFGEVGVALSLAANLTFLVFAETALCGVSLRYGFNAPWLVGISVAVMSIASFLAVSAATLFHRHPLDYPTTVAIASALALAVLVLFLRFATTADMLGSWGMKRSGENGRHDDGSKIIDEQRLPLRVFELSCQYGFTKREEEVCALLAQGVNVAGIEEALVISNSTAKTHVAHIYKKMDVHSIAEFRAAFTR